MTIAAFIRSWRSWEGGVSRVTYAAPHRASSGARRYRSGGSTGRNRAARVATDLLRFAIGCIKRHAFARIAADDRHPGLKRRRVGVIARRDRAAGHDLAALRPFQPEIAQHPAGPGLNIDRRRQAKASASDCRADRGSGIGPDRVIGPAARRSAPPCRRACRHPTARPGPSRSPAARRGPERAPRLQRDAPAMKRRGPCVMSGDRLSRISRSYNPRSPGWRAAPGTSPRPVRARAAGSVSASSSSISLPWRTSPTPVKPRAGSALPIALPCGSSTPGLSLT